MINGATVPERGLWFLDNRSDDMGKEDFRPLSFWSFNGEMEDEEIRTQVRQLAEQGFGGFFMHARAGLTLEYMGEAWFRACRIAVEEAKKQNLAAWLYDENGWPSGFAGGKVPALGEDYTAKHLCFIDHLPGKEDGRLLAAYRVLPDGSCRRIPEQEAREGDLFCCLGQLMGYADLLNPRAMKAFIQFTHEKYKEELGEYFGNVIPGIFTDEPQLAGKFPYTFAFPELFYKANGYDFFDEAWRLTRDGMEHAAFKYQASKLIAELFRTAFTEQIENWCLENHLEFTGHFANEDGLCNQTCTSYDLMTQYGVMSRPGIDFLGRRLTSPVLVKQVSDGAYLAGRKRVTSESFGCSGWDVSFNDLLWIAQWQAAFGINSIVTHLSAYSMRGRRKRDYPAFFSYQEPWWEIFKNVSSKIVKVNEFLAEGRRDIRLLVVHPVTSIWCALAGAQQFSEEARHISNQFRMLVEQLLDLQKDFLIVTEEELVRFDTCQGRLCREDIECPTVIVPDSISLNRATLQKLQELSENGGNVVYINRRPVLCEGVRLEAAVPDSEEANICGIKSTDGNMMEEKSLVACGVVVENRRGLLEKYFLATGQSEEVLATDGFSGKAVSGVILSRRVLADGTQRVLLMNPSHSDTKKLYLQVKGRQKIRGCENNEKYENTYDGEDTFVPMTLTPTECVCVTVQEECVPAKRGTTSDWEAEYRAGEQLSVVNSSSGKQPCLSAMKQLSPYSVELLSPNALTVGHCDVYVNDILLCENVIPAACADAVYQHAYESGKVSRVRLIYQFSADFKGEIPKDLRLVAESDGILALSVNETDVLRQQEGWWIDKSFHVFPIAGLVQNGTNRVELEFEVIRPEELEEQGDFEGYRNRFFYPVEPEDIYITGSFDVRTESSVLEGIETLHTDGGFTLTDSTGKHAGELTGQNLWFYRGNVSQTYSISDIPEGTACSVRLEDWMGTAAEILVNGQSVGVICRAPYRIPVTEYIVPGENTLTVILYGSNRNLLGPHHHIYGNPHFVGISTFLGKRDWTDFINPQIVETNTHTDRYSFVKLDCGRVVLEWQ